MKLKLSMFVWTCMLPLYTKMLAVQTSCLSSNINEKLADSVLTHPCAGQAILVKSHGVIDGTEEGIQDHIACNDCSAWSAVPAMAKLYMIPDVTNYFEDSRQICQKCGGDVAVFNVSDVVGEMTAITNAIAWNSVDIIWIGIKRKSGLNRDQFQWLDGRDFLLTDISWDPGQPNDLNGNQDCLTSYRSFSWRIHDHSCKEYFHVLCQRDPD
ncbi:C-type lectin domain family 4 member G-like [Apostichopus japonicus]|uniref:C-type lectin domain family 4 member G-like n=1 Tax=Stichopus japonicus TaxID=307972 RepID=UPI003AB28620